LEKKRGGDRDWKGELSSPSRREREEKDGKRPPVPSGKKKERRGPVKRGRKKTGRRKIREIQKTILGKGSKKRERETGGRGPSSLSLRRSTSGEKKKIPRKEKGKKSEFCQSGKNQKRKTSRGKVSSLWRGKTHIYSGKKDKIVGGRKKSGSSVTIISENMPNREVQP